MDEEQQAHFSATTVDYSAPRHYPATTEESYQRPTGVNVSAVCSSFTGVWHTNNLTLLPA